MIKEFYCKGTPLTPTNREAGSVELPFLFKFISFQFDLNSFNSVTNYESRNSSKILFVPQQIKEKDVHRVKDASLDNDINKAISLSK